MLKKSSETKVLTISQLDILSGLTKGKRTVLVGGCFDVLHRGHTIFLEKAKKEGDFLLVLLESDQKIKVLKGDVRPIHTQVDRAKVLSGIKFVDFIVLLPYIETEIEYDEIVKKIKPAIIAATKGIDDLHHKRVAGLIGAKFKYVTKIVGDYSSTKIITLNRRFL